MPTFPFKLEIYAVDGARRSAVQRIEVHEAGVYTLGRNYDQSIRLDDPRVSRAHLELHIEQDEIVVRDLGSANGTFIGDKKVKNSRWDLAKVLKIAASHEIVFLSGASAVQFQPDDPAQHQANDPIVVAIETAQSAAVSDDEAEFEEIFGRDGLVDTSLITNSDFYAGQTEFAAVGAGIGNFVWVDYLRVFGVPADQIVTIGDNEKCYANYERYCRNSQIPLHERLRSNSTSTPDNIWGFPGYASREFVRSVFSGSVRGLGGIFAVFGEPTFAQSYVPTAQHVFSSLDTEMERIGWHQMFRQGRVYKIRKTSDGRYAIGYRKPRGDAGASSSGESRYAIHIARILHVATGYPAINLVQDLAKFLVKHPDRRSLMVNAYDPHDQVYDAIREQKKSTVIIRGRGIVASRILQRLAEEREKHKLDLQIIHLMRSERKYGTGARFRRTHRPVFNDVEVQPFNWPKACWSGSLRSDIEDMSPQDRAATYATLGGTSTAIRKDWTRIIETGSEEGWYKKVYGTISDILPSDDSGEVNFVIERSGKVRKTDSVYADFIVDCTGLIADISLSPIINDMIETYGLERNVAKPAANGNPARLAGLAVSDEFEVMKMKNGSGRLFVSGQLAGGGPYAPVDSFLGLQYAALRSVDGLSVSDPAVPTCGPLKSMAGWIKWCAGSRP